MRKSLTLIGSTRLAIWLMCLLALTLLLDNGVEQLDLNRAIVGLLGVIGINLLSALFIHRRLRRDRMLLVMHLALLALLVAAALGRLHRFEGHVEVLQGNPFSAAEVVVVRQGPWHRYALDRVQFVQQAFTVKYAPGVRRSDTQALVSLPGSVAPVAFGDDRPMRALGYRFYTTHNKGFAAVLEWRPDSGAPAQRGAIHFPSYPLFDWKQGNELQLGSGPAITVWLHLQDPLPVQQAWSLASDQINARLAVSTSGQRHEIQVGQSIGLRGGRLELIGFRGWMGWRIFYDPALGAMLWAASIAILALLGHVLGDLRSVLRIRPAKAGSTSGQLI